MESLTTNGNRSTMVELDDKFLLSTDIELMAFFIENPGLSGLITEENYKAPSEYMRTYFEVERTFKRYYE